jgi:Tol biopolymer transport system component
MRFASRLTRLALVSGGLVAVAIFSRVRVARSAAATTYDLTPELWGQGLISTPLDELNTVFSPDGKELYWSIALPDQAGGVIVFSRLVNGTWSTPAVAPFSGHSTDWDPFFTPDGQAMIFTSNRPKAGATSPGPSDFDLWQTTRTPNGGWSDPVNLGAPVNTPRQEYYPSIASDGTLYFSSNRDGGQGSFDIFRSRLVDGKYTEPENLGPEVNSKAVEIDNYIAPDQSFIIFNSSGRPDDLGRGDLYISYNREGKWTPAIHLPAPVNSPAREYCPIGSPDGKWLYFTSKRWPFDGVAAATIKVPDLQKAATGLLNGGGNIYRVPMRDVLAATGGK